MTKRAKPVVHARDHEHGGADPHRIHYESVGGDAVAAAGYQTFAPALTTIAAGTTQNMTFGAASGDALTTAFSSSVRVFADPGIYAIDVNVDVNSLAAGYALNLEISAFPVPASGITVTAGTDTTSTFAGRTAVGTLAASDLLQIAVRNGDTVSRDFNMFCAISRLG